MKVGLKLNTQFTIDSDPVECVGELIEQVRAARDAGFDSIWVSQHYLATPYQAVQTWPMLARIVPESGDMTIGTSVFLLTLHNPVYAAEMGATLDVLSGGRFVYGVGLGYRPEEFEAFSVPMKTRVSRFTEALEVMARLWQEDRVSHQGKHFTLTDASLLLKPVQRPHPPIWIAASSDAAVERAGRLGYPWLVNPHASLVGIERQMATYRAAAEASEGRVPDVVPVFKEFAIATTRDRAIEIARPYLEGKYASYATWGLDKPMPEEERLSVPFDELARDRFIIGDPEECAKELFLHHDVVGANHFLLRMQWPGMPQELVLEQIDLAGRDLLPLIRDARRP